MSKSKQAKGTSINRRRRFKRRDQMQSWSVKKCVRAGRTVAHEFPSVLALYRADHTRASARKRRVIGVDFIAGCGFRLIER